MNHYTSSNLLFVMFLLCFLQNAAAMHHPLKDEKDDYVICITCSKKQQIKDNKLQYVPAPIEETPSLGPFGTLKKEFHKLSDLSICEKITLSCLSVMWGWSIFTYWKFGLMCLER